LNARAALMAGATSLVASLGCDGDSPPSVSLPASVSPALEQRYLTDASFRRGELLASLDGVDDQYADLRRAHYASADGQDWDQLPEWNPAVSPLAMTDFAAGARASADAVTGPFTALAIADDATLVSDQQALRALGEAAFFSYPVQLLPASLALGAGDLAGYGLWIDDQRGVGGLVGARMADGSTRLAYTCATCHSAAGADGQLTVGLGNDRLNLGALLADAAQVPAGDPLAAQWSQALRAWGAGRVDVTTTTGTLPVRLSDLRPTRWLGYLHYEATVQQRDLISLAIRLETLIITSHGTALRPPRAVTLGLALFLWSLADDLPSQEPSDAVTAQGQAVLETNCGRCHAGVGLTGAPVVVDAVGTDPAAALDPGRGRGVYRVPALRGVGRRATLLHDGSIRGLDAFFDPARVAGTGPVAGGHPFGLDLDPAARASLIAYLRGL
jgi:mono/diheme cytochrome c family protein